MFVVGAFDEFALGPLTVILHVIGKLLRRIVIRGWTFEKADEEVRVFWLGCVAIYMGSDSCGLTVLEWAGWRMNGAEFVGCMFENVTGVLIVEPSSLRGREPLCLLGRFSSDGED